jgi:hypothetical protein
MLQVGRLLLEGHSLGGFVNPGLRSAFEGDAVEGLLSLDGRILVILTNG